MTLRSALALLALLCVGTIPLSAGICDVVVGNQVTNCGFETGDFTGEWGRCGTGPCECWRIFVQAVLLPAYQRGQ